MSVIFAKKEIKLNCRHSIFSKLAIKSTDSCENLEVSGNIKAPWKTETLSVPDRFPILFLLITL